MQIEVQTSLYCTAADTDRDVLSVQSYFTKVMLDLVQKYHIQFIFRFNAFAEILHFFLVLFYQKLYSSIASRRNTRL